MVDFPEFQYFISVTYLNAWTFRGCTTLKTVHMTEKLSGMGNGILYQAGGGKTIIMLSKNAPGTPPSTDSTWRSNTFFVHNESIKAYRAKDYWTTIKNRIYGFVSGPIEIINNGQYQYKLQTYFSDATNFSLTLQQNDYLSMEFSDGIGVVTATGITPDTEEEEVNMSYEFNFKGIQYSGTFGIIVKYREIIDFEDAEVKRICVANWGGEYCASSNLYGVPGELTYEQAAAVSSIGTVFKSNTKITSLRDLVHFTGVTSMKSTSFESCTNVLYIEIPVNVTEMGFGTIRSNTKLKWIKLWPNSTITMSGNNCLHNTNNCHVYVPDDLVSSYKTAANWKQYASRFYPISEYTG